MAYYFRHAIKRGASLVAAAAAASSVGAAAWVAAGTATTATTLCDTRSDIDELKARVRALQTQCDNLARGGGGGGFTGAPIAANRPLASRHRVALTAWAVRDPRDEEGFDDTAKSFRSPEDLFAWLRDNGYEGAEFTVDDIRARFMPGASPAEIVTRVRACAARYGVPIIGSLYHVSDGWSEYCGPQQLDYAQPDFWERVREKLLLEREMGSEYVTYQLCLPPRHMNTGGAYRNDDAYLQEAADRIARLQRIAFDLGLNFYVETHIDRVSEDPEAMCKIMDRCPAYFELNADISHYNYRGIKRGEHLRQILARVGHTHQRMAREHGDLSSGVLDDDVARDWREKGVTYQAMRSMEPALQGGLSSRAIVGESGPAFLVRDALELDARLVPLYRHMARFADERADSPTAQQRNPFH